MFQINFYTTKDNDIAQFAVEKLKSNLPDWQKDIWQFVAQLCNPAVQHISIFTSGSTGAPKEVRHSKQAIFNSANMTCEVLNLKPGPTGLLCLPADKIGGMMLIARCFYNKMNLYAVKPSSNPLKSLKPEIKIDFASFTPMQFHEILNDAKTAKKVESISKILLGGQALEQALEQKVKDLKNDVYLTFGMTETVSHIALKKLSSKRPDKYYKLLPNIKIDADNRGCMIVKAPALGCPHLVTNDIIRIISNKEFEWLGRWDNVVNTGGIKIFPEELERRLLPYIKPAFFLAGVPDDKLGQKLVLVIEAKKMSLIEMRELSKGIGLIDKIRRPKEILLVKAFIRTENGKIRRGESLNKVHKNVPLTAHY